AGSLHTCAVLSDGRVKCWGTGGLLGLGDTVDRGGQPNQMGDNLPAVDLGTGQKALALSRGKGHTRALLADSRLKCLGACTAAARSAWGIPSLTAISRTRWATTCPPSISVQARRRLRSLAESRTPARCSPTTASSAGETGPTARSVWAARTRAAPFRRTWATT